MFKSYIFLTFTDRSCVYFIPVYPAGYSIECGIWNSARHLYWRIFSFSGISYENLIFFFSSSSWIGSFFFYGSSRSHRLFPNDVASSDRHNTANWSSKGKISLSYQEKKNAPMYISSQLNPHLNKSQHYLFLIQYWPYLFLKQKWLVIGILFRENMMVLVWIETK